VNALIEVRLTPQRDAGFDITANRICNFPEVTAVFLISGGYDLLVSIEGKTLLEVSKFVTSKLSTIDNVISTATHFVLKKYKDHGTIMTQKNKPERMLVTP
jgi:DNA-binding Lrp family transcriptional regulator